jgi:hypothetical protein
MMTGIDDDTISTLLVQGKNSLQYLEKFSIQESSRLTMNAVQVM